MPMTGSSLEPGNMVFKHQQISFRGNMQRTIIIIYQGHFKGKTGGNLGVKCPD